MDMASLQHKELYQKVVASIVEEKIEPEPFLERDKEKSRERFLRDLEEFYNRGPEVFEERKDLWSHFHHENLIHYYKVNYEK
ncbi:MAG: hypothetical protein ACUVXA_12830 [Candidatus Jordarchaeum sp.]|uniref:hypothetical protein n=1 Tax=Candidatus Jordarchaeum sp. TaxID=2823881 RepID=UPI00404B0957